MGTTNSLAVLHVTVTHLTELVTHTVYPLSVPMRKSHRVFIACAVFSLWSAAPAAAQPAGDPTFKFAKPDAPKEKDPDAVEWKATTKAGLIVTRGNSSVTTAQGAISLMRKESGNKLAFDASLAYVRTTLLVAADKDAPGTPGAGVISADEIEKSTQTTANAFALKLRYDRFLTEHNSLFVTGLLSGDQPAGKELIGGGQAGYSRQLLKSESQEAIAELGYDFSYEQYVAKSSSVSIHSARALLGYTVKVSDSTGAYTNVEVLANLNEEKVPTEDGTNVADPFQDFRVIWKAGLTTTIWKNVSFGFDFGLRYDNVPAPRPAFKLPYAPGFTPLAETLDTLMQASVIVNFL
jgi:hypothetical protein